MVGARSAPARSLRQRAGGRRSRRPDGSLLDEPLLDDEEKLLGIVGPLTKNGPTRAREARRVLKAEIEQHPFDPAPRLWAHAKAEADRNRHLVEDLLTEEADTKAHPAKALAGDVGALARYDAVLDGLKTEIGNSLTDACPAGPLSELEQATIAWHRVAFSDDLTRVSDDIGEVHDGRAAKLVEPGCKRVEATALTQLSAEREKVDLLPSRTVSGALGLPPPG